MDAATSDFHPTTLSADPEGETQMTLNLTIQQQMHTDFTPRITVIGVGGGGTNAVDNMIALNLQGVEFVVANTDAQQLTHSRADRRIQLGPHLTQGLGAGAKPEIGRAAAEEASDELARHLDGVHMLFITAGMGGGTGTGAAPVIARMARERGILTIGVVTKPFTFEGIRRTRSADTGLAELQQYVDTLIVIPNQNLFRLATERTSWQEAFKMADQVLYMGVRGITDLMVTPGLVNLDFADVRSVMHEMGKAMMGTGEADGDGRAIAAAEAAISNPLLEDTSMAGARGLLINITGGPDMTLYEVDEAANRIRQEVAEDANIIFGSAIDEHLSGRIRVSVVATGIDTLPQQESPRPRLVAVGGGVAIPTDSHQQHIPVQNALPAGQPSHAEPPVMQPLRAPSAGATVLTDITPPATSFAPTQPAPQAAPQVSAPRPSVPVMPPPVMPRSPSALFATPSQPPAPARTGLFGLVTGAIRRTPAPPPEPAPAPAATLIAPAPRYTPPAPAAADEAGLDIPAFLRRQSS